MRRRFDLENMSVGAAEILPGEAVPAPDFPDQLDPGPAKLGAGPFQIIDFECDNWRGCQRLLALVAAEDFELLTGLGCQDRLLVSFDPHRETENIAKEAHAPVEVVSRNTDPGKRPHSHRHLFMQVGMRGEHLPNGSGMLWAKTDASQNQCSPSMPLDDARSFAGS
jgi:hypothetical protein